MNEDIRWKQRFNNYNKAFGNLQQAIKWLNERDLSDIEKEGLVQRFEYTEELAWKLLKDYLNDQGVKTEGSKDVIRKAINLNILSDSVQEWIDMIDKRNKTSHTYNSEILTEVLQNIVDVFYPLLENLHMIFSSKLSEQ